LKLIYYLNYYVLISCEINNTDKIFLGNKSAGNFIRNTANIITSFDL